MRARSFVAVILLAIGIWGAAATLVRPQTRLTPGQSARGPKTATQILDENTDAIVLIVAGGGGSLKLGSGLFVQPKGLLLTSLHIIEGMELVGVKLPSNGSVVWARNATGFDSDNDLVVLRVETAPAKSARLGDSDEVRVGEPIVVVGNPEGLEQTVSNGLVSAIRELGGRKLFQISAPISEGSSGSPVFNEYGEVIGVVVSSIQSGQNLNFAVPINYAKPLFERLTQEPISSLPKRNRADTEAGPSQNGSAEAGPTLEETLDWLAEKVSAAGYNYCQNTGKTLGCEKVHYESVEPGDCKLTFAYVAELYKDGSQTFRYSAPKVLSLRAAGLDISVKPWAFRCDKPCRSDFGDREYFSAGGVFFASRDLADRVAKAINHAIALCGKEPF
jgi:hypothetical protein